jgi:phosphatidylglycerophosphate synthase
VRSADIATLLRIPLLMIAAYAIVIRANPVAVVVLMAFLFLSDAFDGYFASVGKHSLSDLASYLLHEATGRGKKRKFPKNVPGYAAYLDIGMDRLIEYVLWLLFTCLAILPILVFIIVFLRNTLADSLVFRKRKTFSKMHSRFGNIASSHFSRGAYGALKAINFAYLALVVVAGWPVIVAYALTVAVVAFSLARGAAEIYEAIT